MRLEGGDGAVGGVDKGDVALVGLVLVLGLDPPDRWTGSAWGALDGDGGG